MILLGACCMVSCKKFLNEYSQTDIKPETTEHFGEIIYSDGYPDIKDPMHSFTVFLDDDVECYYGPTLGNSGISRITAPVFQWQPDFQEQMERESSSFYYNAWFNYYKRILGANVVIQFIDGAVGPQRTRTRSKERRMCSGRITILCW